MTAVYVGFLLLVLLVCVIIFLICIYEFFSNLKPYRIGYLPTVSEKVLQTITDASKEYYPKLDSKKEVNFVELGAGLANISFSIYKTQVFKKVYAVEIDFVWHYITKFFASLSGKKMVFVHKNIFDYKIPENSVIYCYLGDTIIQKLYDEGFFKNQVMISTSFKLKDVEPTKTVYSGKFYRNIYVYDFTK